VKLHEKHRHFFSNLPRKINFSLQNCLKKSKFFDPHPQPPDFKPDSRRWKNICRGVHPIGGMRQNSSWFPFQEGNLAF